MRGNVLELIAREPLPRSAAVNELAFLVRADVERPEAAPRAFGLGEADDDEVVDPVGADLQPVAGAATPIRAVGLLRHDAFEAELHDLLVQCLGVLLAMLRIPAWARLRPGLTAK